jgi:hypothetical protein
MMFSNKTPKNVEVFQHGYISVGAGSPKARFSPFGHFLEQHLLNIPLTKCDPK